jgi:hypothetical protein
MTIEDTWAQLELDLSWRQEEMRVLSNALAGLTRKEDRERARRSHLVMLYAHVEGYSKVALATYVRAINDLELNCQQLEASLVACAFEDVFHALEYGDPKGKVFKNPLPNDASLNIFSRRREFIAELQGLLERRAHVPGSTVDTEGNLNPKTLRRNLYRLGFPADIFQAYERDLYELVNRRHDIAHGLDVNPIRETTFEKLQRVAFHFMDELTLLIVEAIEGSSYLKKPA